MLEGIIMWATHEGTDETTCEKALTYLSHCIMYWQCIKGLHIATTFPTIIITFIIIASTYLLKFVKVLIDSTWKIPVHQMYSLMRREKIQQVNWDLDY